VVGGAISATIASGFTAAMGNAWLKVCQQVSADKLDVLDSPAVAALFESTLAQQLTKKVNRS
jgi:uncharacterized protein (DUF697 family)